MTHRMYSLISRLFRLDRASRVIYPMRRFERDNLSIFHKNLALHITATTQSAGRGLMR